VWHPTGQAPPLTRSATEIRRTRDLGSFSPVILPLAEAVIVCPIVLDHVYQSVEHDQKGILTPVPFGRFQLYSVSYLDTVQIFDICALPKRF